MQRLPQHKCPQYASSSIMTTGGSARASSPGRPFTAAPTFRRAAWPPALMALPLPVTTFGGAVSPLRAADVRQRQCQSRESNKPTRPTHRECPEPSSRTTSGVTR